MTATNDDLTPAVDDDIPVVEANADADEDDNEDDADDDLEDDEEGE